MSIKYFFLTLLLHRDPILCYASTTRFIGPLGTLYHKGYPLLPISVFLHNGNSLQKNLWSLRNSHGHIMVSGWVATSINHFVHCQFEYRLLIFSILEVYRSYDPSCPSIGWLVGWSVGQLVSWLVISLKEREVTLSCFYRSTCCSHLELVIMENLRADADH